MNKQQTFTIPKKELDVALTLDCGQAFRWQKTEENIWHGVAYKTPLTLIENEDTITFSMKNAGDFETIWKNYFDLERNYTEVCETFKSDPVLKTAVEACPGIRILKQEPWETLCSFIISQNNNIPRIKGIIDRLCRLLGDDLGEDDFSFPSAEKILSAGIEGLAPIRSGFRAKYLVDAAEKVLSGEVDLEKAKTMNLENSAQELKKIKGVGDKVAACVQLYGLGQVDALPVDVWVKRILAELYPGDMPDCTDGMRGIAQQYLFYWRRNIVK